MCGRFYIEPEDPAEVLRDIAEQARANALYNVKSGEIFPSDIVPVMALSRRGERRGFAMRWGYKRADGRLVINARSETAQSVGMFRDGALRRRCLIPATCYFEWEKRGTEKIKRAISREGASCILLAGLYTTDSDMPEFAILTRDAAPAVAFVHDRMPVIMPQDSVQEWLDPGVNFQELLRLACGDVRAV